MPQSFKRYRIEDRLHTDTAFSECRPGDARIDEIVSQLREIRAVLEPAKKIDENTLAEYKKELSEVYKMRGEIDSMKQAIDSTKREIATLYRSEADGKGMRRVAGELDAVVGATEQATTRILCATEEIESHANMLRSAGIEVGGNDCVGAILEHVIHLYEACNFQDLTGQRISKIVGVLKFVEERLDRMIAVWGGLEAFKNIAEDVHPFAADEDSLLNGPKLEDDAGHVDQTDIDSLFD